MGERLKAGHRALIAGVLVFLCVVAGRIAPSSAAEEVDTALLVSVDVSNSVDATRFQLQMEGIAQALEDQSVIDAILNGPQGRILFAMVSWADKPTISIPWTMITSIEDARQVAAKVRLTQRVAGEFTCLAGMLRTVADKMVTQIPAKATRVVVDVSGDGKDNCNPEEPSDVVRDELVAADVTINGLPILEGEEGKTLEPWYREHVMGGNGSFVLPADGFGDFGRAIRQKFVIEISGRTYPAATRSAAAAR